MGRWILIGVLATAVLVVAGSGCLGVKAKDRDLDGLSDEEEQSAGTDPGNPNTDGDRYRDGKDPEPLTYQYPQLDMECEWNDTTNYTKLVRMLDTLSYDKTPKNLPRFTGSYEVTVTNHGTDLTKGGYVEVGADVLGWPGNTRCYSKTFRFGRLEPNQSVSFKASYDRSLRGLWKDLKAAFFIRPGPLIVSGLRRSSREGPLEPMYMDGPQDSDLEDIADMIIPIVIWAGPFGVTVLVLLALLKRAG